MDKIWEKTEKAGKEVLDPDTKFLLWDEEMRARAMDIDQMSEEGKASLEGQTFFGMDEEVECYVLKCFVLYFYALGAHETFCDDEGDDSD